MFIEELVPGTNLEDKNIAFKRILKEGSRDQDHSFETGWLKPLCAFANTDGGKLYVGVDDKTHKIIPLDHQATDKLIRMIYREVKQKVDPGLDLEIQSIPVASVKPIRYVIEITVKREKISLSHCTKKDYSGFISEITVRHKPRLLIKSGILC